MINAQFSVILILIKILIIVIEPLLSLIEVVRELIIIVPSFFDCHQSANVYFSVIKEGMYVDIYLISHLHH